MDSHRPPDLANQYFRVMFPLIRDADGYPPADNEVLWATKTDRGMFRLDNIPFYARGVSCGDIVAVEESERGPQRFRAIVKPSKHSTIRVVLAKSCPDCRPIGERMSDLRRKFRVLGCDTEANYPGFFAIDVPSSVKLSELPTPR